MKMESFLGRLPYHSRYRPPMDPASKTYTQTETDPFLEPTERRAPVHQRPYIYCHREREGEGERERASEREREGKKKRKKEREKERKR